jgi:hypothetical protein
MIIDGKLNLSFIYSRRGIRELFQFLVCACGMSNEVYLCILKTEIVFAPFVMKVNKNRRNICLFTYNNQF